MYTNIYFLGLILSSFVVTNSAYATNPYVVQQQVVVPQRIIQYDNTYFSGVQGLYKVGEQIAQERQASTSSASDDKLDRLANDLEALINVLKSGKTGPAPSEVVPPAPEKPKESTLDDKITNLFRSKCLGCHANQSNGLQIFNKDGKVDVTALQAINIHYRVEGLGLDKSESIMPKNGKPLTNDEMILVKIWLSKFAKR